MTGRQNEAPLPKAYRAPVVLRLTPSARLMPFQAVRVAAELADALAHADVSSADDGTDIEIAIRVPITVGMAKLLSGTFTMDLAKEDERA